MSDTFWEKKYKEGFIQYYPWDSIVSFVFNHKPNNKANNEIKILEIGCGTASNLWFAAREGFDVVGIDCSKTAIDLAKKKFKKDNLKAEFYVKNFTSLDFADNSFDLIIDRAAITHVGFSEAVTTIKEIFRILVPDGKFFFNPYSDTSSSYNFGKKIDDELTINISQGSLMNVGKVCFYDENKIMSATESFKIISMSHIEKNEIYSPTKTRHAEWHVVLKK